MNTDLLVALERHFGATPRALHPVAGGDINAAFRADLADGRRIFVKTNAAAPLGMFGAEARGLAWLAQPGVMRVPEQLGCVDAPGGPRWLALEWIEPGRPGPDFEEHLGRALARLHATGADSFGFEHDNFIGSLPQSNQSCATWSEFYAERRLRPQLARAVGLLPRDLVARIEHLIDRLPEYAGPPEPPARLHGDLWSGNILCDVAGQPCLIDPAVYGGHREVDLAMLQLFGNPGPRFFAAYDEGFPLAEDWRHRIPLYQLYPLLVHVNLFGRSYVSRLAATMAEIP